MVITGPHDARSLSRVQCDFLIEHIDTVRPVIVNSIENTTRRSLLGRQLIRYADVQHRTTTLTDRGRETVCAILADWAEVVIRIHNEMLNRPVEITKNAYGQFTVKRIGPRDGEHDTGSERRSVSFFELRHGLSERGI